MTNSGANMIGRSVGEYQLVSLLGEGGMGVVFKGQHSTLGQVVAIKMLHPNMIKAKSIKERFVREAQAMARLRHPNILQIYNFIENEDGCFIILEYVEGKSFEELLEESGLLPASRAIDLFIPILKAMHYAHSNGVIHRDIKPANLMVLNSGAPKVLDFGTAKLANASGPQLTAAGMTLGTVVYMSPEQLMGRDLSPQADIYSLGVTLYELTTHKLPFYHDDEMKLMRMIMKEPAPPPSMAYPAMPKSLETVILRAIEKDRAKRYASAEEFSAALQQVRAELGGDADATGRESALPDVNSSGVIPVQQSGQTKDVVAPTSGTMRSSSSTGNTLLILGAIVATVGVAIAAIVSPLFNATLGLAIGIPLFILGDVLLLIGIAKRKPAGSVSGTSTVLGSPPPAEPVAAAPVVQNEVGQFLRFTHGPHQNLRVDLGTDTLNIGRAQDNTICLDDAAVSSHHARIDFHQGSYFISDLRSSNGTYLNNQRIQQAPLANGNVLVLGQSRIEVHLAG